MKKTPYKCKICGHSKRAHVKLTDKDGNPSGRPVCSKPAVFGKTVCNGMFNRICSSDGTMKMWKYLKKMFKDEGFDNDN